MPSTKSPSIDKLTLELWDELRSGSSYASKALERAFAARQTLTDIDRDTVAAAVYGLLSHQRRVEHALASAGHCLDPLRAELLCWRVLTGKLSVAQAQIQLPAIDWKSAKSADAALADGDPVRRIAISASLPDWLAATLLEQYGPDAGSLTGSLCARAPLTLRVNTLRASREEVLASLAKSGLAAQPTPLASAGIDLRTRCNVFTLPEFADGKIEMQDEASQLVAELVAPPPHGLTIDYCAGAGGKALALGSMLQNRGRILGLDINARRLEELRRRARRAGLSNVQAVLLSPETGPPAQLKGSADRVLVDAPCSGLGALRRKPEMRRRLNPEELKRLPRLQEEIARAAMELCAPRGRLIYATCTLLRAENENVVERLLSDTNFELIPLKEIIGKSRAAKIASPCGNFLQTFPHIHGTDGFFAAVLRRKT